MHFSDRAALAGVMASIVAVLVISSACKRVLALVRPDRVHGVAS